MFTKLAAYPFVLAVGLFAINTAPIEAAAQGKEIVIQGDLKPFGNPNAPQGGTFNYNLGAEPTTLHPITSTDMYATFVKGYVLDQLLTINPDTYEWAPGLAEKTVISADGMQYTFTIRKDAKFHDGKPITAEDVKFSFDMIFEPKFEAAHLRPYYENIEKAEIVDSLTVRFTAKEKYFGNLDQLATLWIIPKHIYGDLNVGKKMNKTMMGSGPYKLEKYDQGQSITLVRNKDWWGNKVEHFKGMYNVERTRLRFVKEEDVALEMLKKGDIDFIDQYNMTAEMYEKKAVGPEWGKTAVKKKVENLEPKPFGYIGWNQKRDLFKDRDVRLALYTMLNREEINKKYLYGMSLLATGPWNQKSDYADPSVKPVQFDPKKAVEIFKKAGWTDSDKNGVLDKTTDGKKSEFRFTLYYANKDTEKYWVMYQNDLKKIGVDMQLQLLEWNAMLKNVHEMNFDACAMSWAGGHVDLDPKQIWHSSSAVKGGSNYISYSNPEVDKLIDQGRTELDKKKRIKLFQKVYALVAADYPYAFLFNRKFVLYAHTARMRMAKPTFKYTIGTDFWWIDPKK